MKSQVLNYAEFAKSVDQSKVDAPALICNKDTGEKKALQRWTQGMWFSVNGGGHIHSWQPLYK